MCDRKENVKSRKSNRSSCCFCPLAKRRKPSVTTEEVEQERFELPMVTPPIDESPPYIADLPNDLSPGTCITVHGFVKPNCSRFSINLCTSKDRNSDIALHLNPRLSLKYIVRTVRINGSWGTEETNSLAKFELERNKKFDLDVVLTTNEFLVSINGKHICAFVYRMPLTKVKAILAEGFVEVFKVDYKKVDRYPAPSSLNGPLTIPMGEEQKKIPEVKMEMPVIATLPKGFQQGWQLEIYGRVKILPSAFYINLQDEVHLWPHPTIYLHLNARFNTSQGKHLFIRNSWIDGSWGQEERSVGFQFTPGSSFSIAIRKEGDRFSIWVDGQLSGEFRYRGDVEKLNAVYIQGDIDVNYIFMKQKIDDKYFTGKKEVNRFVSL